MRALQIDRDVVRFGAARVASAWRSGAGASRRAATPRRPRPAGPARPRLGAHQPAAVGHLRIRPGRPSTVARAVGSSRSSRSRSFPATRSSRTIPTGVASWWNRCWAAWHATSTRSATHAPRAGSATAATSHTARSPPGSRRATAATPAAAGRPRWSPTRASCTPSPTSSTTPQRCMVEPMACATHAALAAQSRTRRTRRGDRRRHPRPGCIAALARWSPPASLLVAAKHPHQRELVRPSSAAPRHRAALLRTRPSSPARHAARRRPRRSVSRARAAGRAHRRRRRHARLRRIDREHRCRAGGHPARRSGRAGRACPANRHLDLTPLWQREISLQGVYAYGTETVGRRTGPDLRPGGRARRRGGARARSSVPPTPSTAPPTRSPMPVRPDGGARPRSRSR